MARVLSTMYSRALGCQIFSISLSCSDNPRTRTSNPPNVGFALCSWLLADGVIPAITYSSKLDSTFDKG